MAYMSQERKAEIVALAKPILKKYGIKATFGVSNHSTIVCNIKSGKIDFVKNYNDATVADRLRSPNLYYYEHTDKKDYIQVNPYHYRNHFTGTALKFLTELCDALNHGNWDNSDIQTDYFDVGHYVEVNIGKWNKPYVVEK